MKPAWRTAHSVLVLWLLAAGSGCSDSPIGLASPEPRLAKVATPTLHASYELAEIGGGGALPFLTNLIINDQGQEISSYTESGLLTLRQNGRFKMTLDTRTNCVYPLTGADCGTKKGKVILHGTYELLFDEICPNSAVNIEFTEQDGRQWGGFFYTAQECPDPSLPVIDMSGFNLPALAWSGSTWAQE